MTSGHCYGISFPLITERKKKVKKKQKQKQKQNKTKKKNTLPVDRVVVQKCVWGGLQPPLYFFFLTPNLFFNV